MFQRNEMTDYGLSKPILQSSQIETAEFLAEIEATPPEYRPYLFKIIRTFRESVTQNLPVSQKNELSAKTPVILASDVRVKNIQNTQEDSSGLEDVTLYTDGACQGNPGRGGYGIVLIQGNDRQELSGGFQFTTNNRMEMMAVIVGLKTLEEKSKVMVYSDSQYVVNAIEKGWAKKWQANNWKKSDKKPALNPDLWEQLLALCSQHQVKFNWVKGHAGNPENECCDRLAVQASQQRDLPPDLGYENPPMQP